MKSQVTQIYENCLRSGSYETDEDFDREMFEKFIRNGNHQNYLAFYCWLEWKDYLTKDGWLVRTNHSEFESSDPPTPSPKKSFDQVLSECFNRPIPLNPVEKDYFEMMKLKIKSDVYAAAAPHYDILREDAKEVLRDSYSDLIMTLNKKEK
jgi:hypothetical protein